MIAVEDALVDIAFACEVRELTELFKKHKHLHGEKRFTDALLKARGSIEQSQSTEFQERQARVSSAWKMHRLQWKFLPRDEKN